MTHIPFTRKLPAKRKRRRMTKTGKLAATAKDMTEHFDYYWKNGKVGVVGMLLSGFIEWEADKPKYEEKLVKDGVAHLIPLFMQIETMEKDVPGEWMSTPEFKELAKEIVPYLTGAFVDEGAKKED